MTKPTGSAAFTGALLLAGGSLLFLTAGFEAGARLVPLSVLVPLTVLVGAQLVRDLRTRHSPGPATAEDEKQAGRLVGDAMEPATAPIERAALGWIAGLGVGIAAFGMLAGTSLFVLAWLRRQSRERWLVAVAAAAVTALAFWLILTTALGVPLSGGALGALLAGAITRARMDS